MNSICAFSNAECPYTDQHEVGFQQKCVGIIGNVLAKDCTVPSVTVRLNRDAVGDVLTGYVLDANITIKTLTSQRLKSPAQIIIYSPSEITTRLQRSRIYYYRDN